ncbi:uncharacterized protein [Dysidea avara]|uniref:uncharacterized protein n=1 Tax=Dysidea avara TaxID=196820 RepID=UPI0033273BDB
MAATNKDVVLVVSLVLSLVSLVLLFGVTWYFQSSLDLLQQQVEYDRELLLTLQEQVNSQTVVNIINTHHDVKRQSGMIVSVKMVHQVPLVLLVKQEIREHLEYQDQKEILDQEETLVIGDQED